MTRSRPRLYRSPGRPLSQAEKCGFAALACAAALAPFAPACAALPLACFLFACCLAPFFPGWGFFYPVVSRGERAGNTIYLTFDDGPDPRSTSLILDRLAEYGFSATFFVNGKRARRHPELIREILRQGHAIGNHSYSHEPCIMFRGPARLTREIRLTQKVLARAGVTPALFRPPVGINVPAYAEALHQTGLRAVNFSLRPRDLGNRRTRGLARRILKKIRPGDIVLLHDAWPKNGGEEQWAAELDALFAGIERRGFAVELPLARRAS